MKNDGLVKCGICGYWILPHHMCEDTDGCPYYYHGDIGP